MKSFSILAPFLLAVYPIVFFFDHNKGELPINVLLQPLAGVLIITILLFFGFKVVFKNNTKSAVVASTVVVGFMYYGFVYEILFGFHVGDVVFGRHKYLFPFWFLIFSFAIYYFWTTKRSLKTLVTGVTFIAFVMVFMPFIGIVGKQIKYGSPEQKIDSYNPEERAHQSLKTSDDNLPDIYYIIPDAYAGYEVLDKYFDFKNDEFYDYLLEKGFSIARDSRSNYWASYFSISSTLDMRYINFLSGILGPQSTNYMPVRKIINNNRVLRSLEEIGYEFIHLDSDATTFLDRSDSLYMRENDVDIFMREVMKFTILRPFPGRYGFRESAINTRIRENILKTFDDLQNTPEVEGPKFVFAHITSPHGPYVFGADGEEVDARFSNFIATEEDMKLYVGQLIFVNQKLVDVVESILSKSQNPPIIIIQSDHGVFLPRSKYSEEESKNARFKNLSAYYLPRKSKNILPQNMNAVNTFRFIFDTYFGTNYGLLDSMLYHSTVEFPYKFEEIDK